jgi:succinyl-diaminopimelate desuccinylase
VEPAKGQTNVEFEGLLDAALAGIDREELVHLTRELVRIPSVYRPEEPDGNEARAARFVADYLGRAGFEVRTEEVAPGRPNVWAVWEGNGPGRTLLFEGTRTW